MSTKKKNVPEIMSGMGVGLSILTNLTAELQRRRLPDWLLHPLATPDGEDLIEQFVSILQTERRKDLIKGIYNIRIDYDNLSPSEMFGNLEVEQLLTTTDIFDVKGGGIAKRSVYLFEFENAMFSKDAQLAIELWGFRPAKVEELFALLNQNPKLQYCGRSIIALDVSGQCEKEGLTCSALIWSGADTVRKTIRLRMDATNIRWTNEHCYFAAVPKQK